MKKGYFICLIGISGSGKTTIANELEKQLLIKNVDNIQVIDGDIIREQLGDIFGYTFEERMKCNRIVRLIAQYLVNNGIHVILTQVAAYEEMRRCMREQFLGRYIEIYVKCSVEECRRRDIKGYYKKQEEGLMDHLNGSNEIFQIPMKSELVVNTEYETVDESVIKILDYLGKKDL